MIFPAFPSANDIIGICAPSAGIGHKIESFDSSLAQLRKEGYQIKETASVRNDSEPSTTGKIRAEEFSQLVTDKNISAIISASGGDYAPEMLSYVNWQEVQENPKWIAGASDPTNLLYPITTKLDIATIYGFNAGSFDGTPLHAYQENMLQVLKGNLISQHSFDKYDELKDFSDNPNWQGKVYWDSFIQGTPTSVHLEGRIIGGCIDCITKLVGTPYDGTKDFVSKYSSDGIIWYFDTFDMTPETLYLSMLQMKHCGYFEGATGILFGRVMFDHDAEDSAYLDLLFRCFDIPIIWNTDIGHVKPCMTIINGAMATVDVADGIGTIQMRLE